MNKTYVLTALEISDAFFNFTNGEDIIGNAIEFLDILPSLRNQGITHEDLVQDYLDRV